MKFECVENGRKPDKVECLWQKITQAKAGIAFFCKLAMAYFDCRQRSQFEWTGPVILFACMVFTFTAPLHIWTIVGL